MTVAVCIATFARAEGLLRLLESLAVLELESPNQVLEKIVVVDNDVAGSARSVVESLDAYPWNVEYAIEPRRGVPFARNAAVARSEGTDFVAFIDDDEWAEPRWLAELLQAQTRTAADVVAGPVLPSFTEPPPPWVTKVNYFRPLEFAESEVMHFANTGNVLVRSSLFAEAGFSGRFAEGGEDTHFFLRARRQGARIVWAPGARVHEAIPPDRMRVAWIARREFRRGRTLSRCLVELEPSQARRVKRTAHGIGRIGVGCSLAVFGLAGGPRFALRGLQNAAFGSGLLVGLIDRRPRESPDER